MEPYGMEGFLKDMEQLGIALNRRQTEQFQQFYELLLRWNSVMNLTAITEYDEVLKKHFVDSLSVVKIVDLKKKGRLLDVGTGAGFPGIPIKIAFPEWEVVLLDSLNKRVKFLDEVIHTLGLSGVCALHGRAEELGRNSEYRESFDLVTSRAVANLSSLSEYCLPFTKIGGEFVAYKSGKVQEELQTARRAVGILGGEKEETVFFQLEGTDQSRSLIKIRKVKATSKKYPRKAGVPSKEPLA